MTLIHDKVLLTDGTSNLRLVSGTGVLLLTTSSETIELAARPVRGRDPAAPEGDGPTIVRGRDPRTPSYRET